MAMKFSVVNTYQTKDSAARHRAKVTVVQPKRCQYAGVCCIRDSVARAPGLRSAWLATPRFPPLARPSLPRGGVVRAADSEVGAEKPEVAASATSPAEEPAPAPPAPASPVALLPSPEAAPHTGTSTSRPAEVVKSALLDAICGTERGLVAKSEVRADINELVNQLEVSGGGRADITDADFAGCWELLYSNAAEMVALLALNRLPGSLVRVGAVTQTIDAAQRTVENTVQLQFPLITTSLSTMATYDVASPKRLQYTLQRGILHTPAIERTLGELPASVTFMGQSLDTSLLRDALAPLLRDALAPLQRGASSLAASASDLLGQAPDLELPLQTSSWQLTTYLDPELRVARGDGGAVYVFRKVVKGSNGV